MSFAKLLAHAGRKARELGGLMGNQVTHDEDGGGASADLHCVGCGYHLRGLAEDGTCPECGTAVARSMRGDLLSAADPAWMRRVYRGQTLMVIGCMVMLAWIPVALLLAIPLMGWCSAPRITVP